MSNLIVRILVGLILAPFAGLAVLMGWLEFTERQQIRTYYAEREILRAVHGAGKDLPRGGDAKADAEARKAVRRHAFMQKLPAGTDRNAIFRILAAEGMNCVPESMKNRAEARCMAIGHSGDFRWYFILRFSNEDKLLDAEIRTLKGA